jgi:hypothetical protein
MILRSSWVGLQRMLDGAVTGEQACEAIALRERGIFGSTTDEPMLGSSVPTEASLGRSQASLEPAQPAAASQVEASREPRQRFRPSTI